jgi:hypothetical protein
LLETNRINCPVCVAIVIVDDFQNTRTCEAFQGLRPGVLFAKLRKIEWSSRLDPIHRSGLTRTPITGRL